MLNYNGFTRTLQGSSLQRGQIYKGCAGQCPLDIPNGRRGSWILADELESAEKGFSLIYRKSGDLDGAKINRQEWQEELKDHDRFSS